ncbi:hypothetical protein GCM10009746_03240 [Microbacterium paludicola]
MVRFLERNGYDVSYTTDVDSDRRGELIQNHRVFTSTGHDEYWSGPQRAHIEAARDAGVNLAFFTGNEAYWRIRWEAAAAGDPIPYRTMTSYKETWSNRKLDASSPQWTGTWRDPRFASQADGGGLPENALTGTAYMVNYSDLPVTVSAAEGALRLWRHTSLAALPEGTSAELAPHTIGYESNEDLDNGFRPEGLIRLSTTVGEVPEYLQDFGSTVGPGTTTHHTTLYRAASGALVFSSGSVQWAWGLDQQHDGAGAPADQRMQQATVNLLADMNAQPTTLQDDLKAAAASTDETPPTVAITSPAPGQDVENGTQVIATGTAADAGGGRVAAVEVSTDAGATWHPATGTTAWSYEYVQTGEGAAPLLARAVDDSARIGEPARVDVDVRCPCSLFGAALPAQPAVDDSSGVELGLRFRPQIDGFARGVRFFKGPGNVGTHVGSLWTADRQRLATVTFADDPATGWQTATFDSAVPLTAGVTYVVSYAAPSGHYAAAEDAFWYRGHDAPPLAVEGGFGAEAAGVYAAPGDFPSSSWGSSHYFVDVLFDTVDDTPLTISGRSPVAGSTSVGTAAQIAATLSKPVDATSVQLAVTAADGGVVAGAVSYDPQTRRALFVPTEPLQHATVYTAAITALDAQGNGIAGDAQWSFTTAPPVAAEGQCPCSLYTETAEPGVLEVPDPSAVTLGVRFAPSADGTVTAIRFYKGPGNVGPHTGELWRADGTRIAEGAFTDESAQGWQTLVLDEPVSVTKDAEYIAAYRTTVGRYSYTTGSYATEFERGPLRVPANGGAYSYDGGFPGDRSAGSYLVDVVFEPDAPVPTVIDRAPADGVLNADPGAPITARFDRAVAAGAQLTVSSPSGPVAGTSALSPDGLELTYTPEAPLAERTRYTATTSGTGGPDATWWFETASADGCPCGLFAGAVPDTASASDGARVELGVGFAPTEDGVVTGVRFYRGAGNAGPHTGTLWDAAGGVLATVSFSATGDAGWQTALFEQPVEVRAGTSYVASYLAPQGGYAVTSEFFTGAPLAVGPLEAAAFNGRYAYGGGFPQDSYRGSNYFVDVVFERG